MNVWEQVSLDLIAETVSRPTIVFQIVSKSFAYVAILSLVGIALFIVILDILKYGFHIDPAKDEAEQLERKALAKNRKRRLVVQRFIYVP